MTTTVTWVNEKCIPNVRQCTATAAVDTAAVAAATNAAAAVVVGLIGLS